MAAQNHLKLVVSNQPKTGTINKFIEWLNKPRFFKIPFVKSESEKIAALEKYYKKKYRIEDLTNPDSINIPYFLRAGQKISEIIKKGTINAEYNKNCRFNKNFMGCI